MVVTVTMNPALDKTAETDEIVAGGLNRLFNVVLDAGGKGINVSKMIAALGGSSIATGFLGGGTGAQLEQMLNMPGIEPDFIRIAFQTRTNLKVHSKESGITEFNEPGAELAPEDMPALKEKLLGRARPGSVFVFAGSLPRNAPADTYKQLILAVKAKGAAAFLDADGEAFRLALEAEPDFIKPNKYELLQYFGVAGEPSLMECAKLCRRLTGKTGRAALSRGAEGAIFVSAEETLYAPGLKIRALSTVGAGDSMVGAFAYAAQKAMRFRDTAALAMAASAGACTTEGTKPPSRETVEALLKQVKFEQIP
jgi:1-phosphofructokinase